MSQVQVQLRVPKEAIKDIDSMVKTGRFKSRSDAIKTMIFAFEEREKTRAFYNMLTKRSKEALEEPNKLIKFSDL
ncbi:MAG: ribbon-helix-helix domain-containing protein [archaeon]